MADFHYHIDTHIHTEGTSPYLKGDANLQPYYDAGHTAKLHLMCITDHFHYITQNPKYLFDQRTFIDQNKLTNPKILLGAEHTILNGQGKIGIRPKTAKILDMINLSLHWFGMGTPGFFGGTRLGTKDMEKVHQYINNNNPKGRRFLQYSTKAYVNALRSKKIAKLPKIICHPWDEYIESGLLLEDILKEAEKLVKGISEMGAAFEFNNDSCRNLLNLQDWFDKRPDERPTPKTLTPDDFLEPLFKIIGEYGVWISVSSDAHKLENIGGFQDSIKIIEKYKKHANFTKVKLVNDEFFKM